MFPCNIAVLGPEDGRNTLEFDDHFVILPQFEQYQADWQRYPSDEGRRLSDGFYYGSEKNKEWLTVEELRQLFGVKVSECASV